MTVITSGVKNSTKAKPFVSLVSSSVGIQKPPGHSHDMYWCVVKVAS